MSDDVESLVDDAVGDVEWATPLPPEGATTDSGTEPTALAADEAAQFVPYDLTAFLDGKAMWAANYFVLWPLGLSLVVDTATEAVDAVGWCADPRVHVGHPRPRTRAKAPCAGTRASDAVTNLHVRQWTWPEGELGETINQEPDENQGDYEVFLGFVRDQIVGMKAEERHVVLARLGKHSIASAEQILVAS